MGIGLDGPLSYGMIDFYNSDGSLCEATATDENSFYEITLSPACTFPLKVVMTEGVDASTNLTNPTTLYSLVLDQNVSTININTYTTLVYYAALARTTDGSLRSIKSENVNIDAVTYEITRKFNFGIDAEDTQFNPLKTPVTRDNVVSFVKANEGLMEGIRRTARAASMNGKTNASSIDQILSALGADISDGVLDGKENNFHPQAYEVFQLTGSQLVGIWEANALDVSMELMANRLSISLTEEQKAYKADTAGIPLSSVAAALSPAQVAQNLAAAVSDMVYNLGGFITPDEALQRLEQVGVTRKFLNQTQAALEFQLNVASVKGLNTDSLNSIRDILRDIAGRMDSSGEAGLRFDQIRDSLGKTITETVSVYVRDGGVANETIENAINEARIVFNTSEPLTQSTRKLVAAWEYGGMPPEKFRLYEICNNATKIVCEIPGHARTSELVDCYSNMNEIPKEFYLTAYANGVESAPSPKISYGNKMPVAIFHASLVAGQVPLTVELDAASSYDPDGELQQFMWDFGDGAQASGATVSHIFQSQGTYNILLKTWDDCAASALATMNITVGEAPNTLGDPLGFIGTIRAIDSDPFPSASLPDGLPKSNMPPVETRTSKKSEAVASISSAPQAVAPKIDLRAEEPLHINSKSPAGGQDFTASVNVFLADWLKAWEETAGEHGDIISYGAMYSDTFKSGKFNRDGWVKDKTRKNSRKEWIKLSLKDIEIKQGADGQILVRFGQEYTSSNHSDTTKKELVITREAGFWKIVKETTF